MVDRILLALLGKHPEYHLDEKAQFLCNLFHSNQQFRSYKKSKWLIISSLEDLILGVSIADDNSNLGEP
ncbi:MAG: hypothetical protein JWO91_2751 [Acidobacteriaceae bacterium]|nr:hypothetical protein [Acidobacteriaceae bacterium]